MKIKRKEKKIKEKKRRKLTKSKKRRAWEKKIDNRKKKLSFGTVYHEQVHVTNGRHTHTHCSSVVWYVSSTTSLTFKLPELFALLLFLFSHFLFVSFLFASCIRHFIIMIIIFPLSIPYHTIPDLYACVYEYE